MTPANPRPKAKTDEHLVFLYLCLVNSGGINNIDLNAVAEAANINVPAARMRWSRLKARIEKEMADGSDNPNAGQPSAASTPSVSPAKKRYVKRKTKSEAEDDGVTENNHGNNPAVEAN